MKETYECNECGLIWWGEMLNLVETGNREGTIGQFCPHCGSEDVEEASG